MIYTGGLWVWICSSNRGPKAGAVCKVKTGIQAQHSQRRKLGLCGDEWEEAEQGYRSTEYRERDLGGSSSGRLVAGNGPQSRGVLPTSILCDFPQMSGGPPQARLLKPAHFHLLRYLHLSRLLVWDGTAANGASEAELQSSTEHRARGCSREKLAAV